MGVQRRFNSDWEPVHLLDRILAEGTWAYQGETEHNVRLIQRTWDYTVSDIEAIQTAISGGINEDYIDYAISDDGNVYFWEFDRESVRTTSHHFSSMDAAKKQFFGYAGVSKIRWHSDQ